jgi:hypothetical protein
LDVEDITSKADLLGKALQSKDYGQIIDSTYPKLVEMGGGREKLLAATKAAMEQMAASGMEIISFKAEKPGSITGSGRDLATVVPTTLDMRVNAKTTMSQKSFLLAISSDGGSSWTFIDGSALTPEIVKAVLPESLHGIQLPAKP